MKLGNQTMAVMASKADRPTIVQCYKQGRSDQVTVYKLATSLAKQEVKTETASNLLLLVNMENQGNGDQEDRDREERLRRLREENARLRREAKESEEQVQAAKSARDDKNRELLKLQGTVNRHKQNKK